MQWAVITRPSPRREHRPDVFLPEAVVHLEVVEFDSRVDVAVATGHVGVFAVLAKMHAGGVDRERQVAVERLLGGEDPGVALARFDRQADACHLGRAVGAWPGGVDHLATADGLTGGECHAVDAAAVRVAGHLNHFVGDVLDTAFTRLAPPPIEDRDAFPIAFVDRVDAAEHEPTPFQLQLLTLVTSCEHLKKLQFVI